MNILFSPCIYIGQYWRGLAMGKFTSPYLPQIFPRVAARLHQSQQWRDLRGGFLNPPFWGGKSPHHYSGML